MKTFKLVNVIAIVTALTLIAWAADAEDRGAVAEHRAALTAEALGKKVELVSGELDKLGGDLDKAVDAAEPAAGGAVADPDLAQLLDHRRKMERIKHSPPAADGPVAIVVPIAFFGLVAMLVFLPLLMRNRRRAIDAAVQQRAIEAGMQYIPELPAPALKRHDDRRTGAIIAGVGIALAVPTAIIGHTQIAVFGLAPVLLGVVYFLVGSLLRTPTGE